MSRDYCIGDAEWLGGVTGGRAPFIGEGLENGFGGETLRGRSQLAAEAAQDFVGHVSANAGIEIIAAMEKGVDQ